MRKRSKKHDPENDVLVFGEELPDIFEHPLPTVYELSKLTKGHYPKWHGDKLGKLLEAVIQHGSWQNCATAISGKSTDIYMTAKRYPWLKERLEWARDIYTQSRITEVQDGILEVGANLIRAVDKGMNRYKLDEDGNVVHDAKGNPIPDPDYNAAYAFNKVERTFLAELARARPEEYASRAKVETTNNFTVTKTQRILIQRLTDNLKANQGKGDSGASSTNTDSE